MQSHIPWDRVRGEQRFWERDAIGHLQGMVLWLHNHLQLMLDDLVGRYQDREKEAEQER
jgi:hypothetical protein